MTADALEFQELAAMKLCADLQYERGFAVETTIVWDHPTIDAIAAYLSAEQAAT
jgi:hypothetical protein